MLGSEACSRLAPPQLWSSAALYTVQCSAALYTVHCSAEEHCALHCSAVQRSTAHASPLPQLEADKLSSKVQYFSILQCSISLHCSAVFHYTALQYFTTLHCSFLVQFSAGHYSAVHSFSSVQCTPVGIS